VLIPFIRITIKSVSFKDYDSPEVMELRKRLPVLDVKLSIYEAFDKSLAEMKEIFEHKLFYALVTEQFLPGRAPFIAKLLDNTVLAQSYLIKVLKKPKLWWRIQFIKNGKSKRKMLEAIIGPQVGTAISQFHMYYESVHSFKLEYESTTGTVVDK
jgi:hypothetical protein